ncbi:MAG: DNA mismatch repair protein MutS [Myxococcota bacterium]
MTDEASTPRACYERRLGARGAVVAERRSRARLLANLRLAVFTLALILAGLGFRSAVYGWGAGLAGLAFLALVLAHDSARRELERAERAVAWYERGLDRLAYRFAGRGRSGERFARAEHPYAEHLDLFGNGSIFELLSLAQTAAGEGCLASWLLEPAAPDEIRARQAAVAELRERLDLREDFAKLGPDLRDALHAEALSAWGAEPALIQPTPALRLSALALPSATLAAALLGYFAGAGILPLVAVLALQGSFALWLRGRVRHLVQAVERPARELAMLVGLLARLECERFDSPRLAALRSALATEGLPPSRQVAQLGRILTLLDSRRNQLFALIAPFLLWTTQLALALESWRLVCGPRVAEWIRVLGEFEALSDLASYAYEHPDDPFPELAAGGTSFEAEGLGHPLLPESVCVRNDVRLDSGLALLIVSGSNMSGKSTLLRSVGTSVALALAGAPVRAKRMRLSPLSLGASLWNPDSLLEGTSRFYAEITCLKRIVALAEEPPPLLFLLDEILQGTNSHDRRIGATEVVKGLVDRGAIGLITTHDLALTEMVEAVGRRARNVHFEDQLENGRMSFDYRLRDGVVARGNALALMRAVGLKV